MKKGSLKNIKIIYISDIILHYLPLLFILFILKIKKGNKINNLNCLIIYLIFALIYLSISLPQKHIGLHKCQIKIYFYFIYQSIY